jgi:hypothetical protein
METEDNWRVRKKKDNWRNKLKMLLHQNLQGDKYDHFSCSVIEGHLSVSGLISHLPDIFFNYYYGSCYSVYKHGSTNQ